MNHLTYTKRTYIDVYNSPNFMYTLISKIQQKLRRVVANHEVAYIKDFIQKVDMSQYYATNPNVVCEAIADTISKQIANITTNKYKTPTGDIDIHEMLKDEVGSVNADGTTTGGGGVTAQMATMNASTTQVTTSFAKPVEVAAVSGYTNVTSMERRQPSAIQRKSAYMILDSRHRISTRGEPVTLQWNFITNELVAEGSVNAIGNIKDIITIRINPFRIPYTDKADNDYKRVSVFIQELSAQSYIAQENKRFHFMMTPTLDKRWIELSTDDVEERIYRFRTPITRPDTITLSFGSPLESIVFDPDRLDAIVTAYGAATSFDTTSAHTLQAGDLVYISGFRTLNDVPSTSPTYQINRTEGHIITNVGTTTFDILVDTTSIQVAGVGTIDVINGDTIVVGTATNFYNIFVANDVIDIAGVRYNIASITSTTTLVLTTPYAGVTAGGLAFSKNNINYTTQPTIFFGSKRIMVPLIFEYIESVSS